MIVESDDLLGETLVPILAQIEVAERELKYRLKVYPRWVDAGKISADTAAQQLRGMRAIVDTLQRLHRGELKVGM